MASTMSEAKPSPIISQYISLDLYEPNLTIPLSNARTTSVGQDDATELPHGVGQAVALDRGTDLLGAGGDVEVAPGLKFNGNFTIIIEYEDSNLEIDC